MTLKSKDLLGIEKLSKEEIELILHTAQSMREIVGRPVKKLPTLRGRSIINLFYEPSTRTRTSFELAGKYLGADTVNIATSSSSVVKGETLIDTGKTIEAMGVNIVVIRHPQSGAPHLLANNLRASIINAGDGTHEHPTQALLDMYTILEKKSSLQGLKVAIIGDVLHSRVARSNIWGLTKMGAAVHLAGPPTLLPKEPFMQLGVTCHYKIEEAIAEADVVMVLRIQKERQEKGLLPSLREYSKLYGITAERLKLAKADALVLHPGPMNRGIEIASNVADGVQSVIQEQVTNGVAVRMALLYLLSGGDKKNEDIN
ncbi:MAG: aspartate carbamoyltransferase catalytic subunit [Bacillota bacterium]|nr:aspartate carbamoyltransferase catalytic subunit [Bacillota bacterium]